ncbi:MAG: glycoside hydrolase 43 family protein [Tepidisphaeraceae bacterium]|jgi:beta-xylosidase
MNISRRQAIGMFAAGVVAGLKPGIHTPAAHGQPTSEPAELAGAWGDQGDGTYVNPIIPADFSDLDAIRVGDDFYAISSTLHMSPGMVVLHSKDLVNWRIIGHVVADVSQISPEMNWDHMNRYGRGVWAGAIRYHDGKFWVYFATPDEGIFMATSTGPAGPWEPLHQVWKTSGYDDTCPFWDDDGQGYLITTHFARDAANGLSYNIHLFKMSADGKNLVMDSDRIVHQSRGSEANKLYKINGTYYHFFSEVKAEGRVVMMNRSKSLAGPWETRQLIHVNKSVDKEPNQGGLIQLAGGDWWFITHQGAGDWEGRAMVLLPVTWINGWPIIGKVGEDGIGNMIWRAKKPIAGGPALAMQTDDQFDGSILSPQWEWNHQPRADKWSLTERPGFVRLHAFKPLRPDDLMHAGNTLTQRSMRTGADQVTIKLDLSGMSDGQEAGLCHFARTSCTLGVMQNGDTRTLRFRSNGQAISGPVIQAKDLWLRSNWDFAGDSRFSFSTDGTIFTPFGTPYRLTWGNYRGDRIGVYNYNNREEAGYVDVDSFQYTFKK